MSVERRGTKALELWAKRATDGYAGVNISNMTTDWRNGLAFCALIHHFKPDLIDFSSLKPENILENNALAFRVAEQQLGIPALLDAEDMVECDIPDRLSVLTYVAQYYQVFASLGLTSPKRVVNNTSPTPSSPAGIKKTKLTPIPPKTKTEIKTDKVSGGGRLRREVCVKCSNPVFLAERLLVGSPGQLMHRTCFRCARCTTQLTLASYYETEKGQFCCETCPDEEITVSPENANSLVTSSSPKLSRRMSTSDSESEYDTDGSDNESDGYSNTVELALEDKTKNSDARSDTSAHSPKLTPGPPKPRTVFLSKTLESGSNDSLNEHKETQSTVDKDEQQFSKVSPALFGSRANDVGTTKASDSGLDHCDDAKGLITDPPDKLTLDTGQDDNSNHATDYSKETPSSIVAQRLKMFREISNKSSSSNIKTNVLYNKPYCKENDVRLQNSDKDSSLQLKVTEAGPCSTTTNEDKVTDKIDKEILHEEITIPKVPVHESVKGIDEDKLSKGEETSVKNDSILQEEKIETKTNEKIVVTSNIPSITISVEEKNNDELQKETKETQDVLPTTKESTITTSEMTVSKESSSSEANPFDLEDESQLDESGIHNQSQGGGSDKDVNIASSLSKDSGAELSSASLHSVQYPEDLNPFGSDEEDDDDVKGAASISQNDKSEASEKVDDTASKVDDTPSKVDDTPKKKLIKVSLNPFDSDEDEDFDEKDSKDDSKSDSKKDKSESKNLNPFWSDDEEPSDSTQSTPTKSKIKPPRPPPPTLARNSTPSYLNQMRDATPSPKRNSQEGRKGSATLSPARELFPQPKSSPGLSQKGLPPSLPTPKAPSSPSSPSASVALKRKGRRAPAPPPQPFSPRDGASSSESTADTMSMDAMSLSSLGTQSQATVGNEDDGQDEVLSRKLQKDMKNHSNKMNGTTEQRVPPPKPARVQQALGDMSGSKGVIRRPSMSKSEAGEWQRKKGPAPPRPVPQKRSVKKMPMRLIQQELHDIEVKQTELERQGVLLETSIRKRTESTPNNPLEDPGLHNSGPSSIEVEDMIMQLFELVNEKNELFRRQTELMYLKREKRLEEEYVDLEYQIRCLMLKLPTEKTEIDTAQEEELIARLVKVVEQRDEIINCLELDRLREAQEDESIATHMMQYQEKHIDGVGIGNGSTLQNTAKKKKTLKLPRKKKKKEKKDKKGAKADADKDIDETEVKETKKKKKKWLF